MSSISDISNLCFIDSETRRLREGRGDVTKCGAYVYRAHAAPFLWAVRLPQDDATWVVDRGNREPVRWADMGADFHAFHERVLDGDAHYVAWNAAFDRLLWNSEHNDFPPTEPEHWLDAMAQATGAGLPGKLGAASKWLGHSVKLESGSGLIAMFEPPRGATEDSAPKEWEDYAEYAAMDVDAMFDVWQHTRPLSRREWQEYWVSERINDRGVRIDRRLCAAATAVNAQARKLSGETLSDVTSGDITSPTQAARILSWVVDRIDDPALKKMLTEKKELRDEEGGLLREARYSLKRERIERALTYLSAYDDLTQDEIAIREVLTQRLWGGSTTPAKFATALRSADYDGVLRGQYVFNGAPQTGRFSSRGVQTHNLTRSHLGEDEEIVIEYLNSIEDPEIDRILEETSA